MNVFNAACKRLAPLLVMLLLACKGESQLPAAPVTTPGPPGVPAKHCRNFNALRNPYFGDLHVHTTYSLDANTQGTLTTPHDAYRFALGEKLGLQPYDANGQPTRFAQLSRPLDFTAVTDHSELLGETEICTNPANADYNSAECLFYRQSPDQAFIFFNLFGPGTAGVPNASGGKSVPRLPYCGVNGERCLEAAKTPWRDIQRAAEAYYDRSEDCRFTTFVGYEYTAAPQSNNLHRNVIFESEVVPEIPPAYQEYPAAEFLWQALSEQCQAADGCNYLTIPHNSNLSAGLMFQTTDDAGNDYTAEFARTRQQNEPLAEIYQHKGQSECLNTMGAGSRDELCGFEVLPYNNLTGNRFGGLNTGPPMEQDFLREALKEGLRLEGTLGVNPFKYGFIGSTDTHLSTPGNAREENFPGHAGAGLNPRTGVPGLTDVIEVSPGGLAVLWAEQNTRESLFAAMRRREAYATSGPRMQVRFFGGWDIPADLCGSRLFVEQGYQRGVPMGGDLPAARAGSIAPRFAVSALRDPGVSGAEGERSEPLQRIQIIKGWVDAAGLKQEKVYEVAGNPDNGAAVNTDTCETSGPGFASLCTVWQDPDFSAEQSAFYYARVVQNPSCRWATYQCNAAQVDCSVPDDVAPEYQSCCDTSYPKSIQERAWSSPIWYRAQ
ncbi:MAG: DUF3604 domain-containing protein [Pseudomonadota bacterium]